MIHFDPFPSRCYNDNSPLLGFHKPSSPPSTQCLPKASPPISPLPASLLSPSYAFAAPMHQRKTHAWASCPLCSVRPSLSFSVLDFDFRASHVRVGHPSPAKPNKKADNRGVFTSPPKNTACWASAGHNIAGCAAVEEQLRACMDAPVPKQTKKNTINYHLMRLYPKIVGPRKRNR